MDDNLRFRMAQAVMKSLNEDHGMEDKFDPDMCYRTADRITAEIMSEVSGYRFEAKWIPLNTIGPALFVTDGILYD